MFFCIRLGLIFKLARAQADLYLQFSVLMEADEQLDQQLLIFVFFCFFFIIIIITANKNEVILLNCLEDFCVTVSLLWNVHV